MPALVTGVQVREGESVVTREGKPAPPPSPWVRGPAWDGVWMQSALWLAPLALWLARGHRDGGRCITSIIPFVGRRRCLRRTGPVLRWQGEIRSVMHAPIAEAWLEGQLKARDLRRKPENQ